MTGDAPRLRFDFPARDGGETALQFARPHRVLVAREKEEVRPVLARADQLARAGAWVAGFVGYEAGAAFDPAFRFRGTSALPLAWFAAFDAPVACAQDDGDAPPAAADWAPACGRERYDEDIAAILAHIQAGDVYQVNHTIRLRGRFHGDDHDLYRRLRGRQPDGYCARIDLGRYRILTLSPELFFRRDGDTLTSKPMKGTMPRGASVDEDRYLADRLQHCEKNRAENLMIVDLIRNDVSRIAVPHSVRVPALFHVEGHPTVWQMTSTVKAQLRPHCGLGEIFAALFPCGSITGAPKIKAMEIIAQRESEPRGIYCGAIGFIRPGGDAVFNVAIRTVVLDRHSGEAVYGVGGGITADSVATDEYAEMLAKTRVLHESTVAATLGHEGGGMVAAVGGASVRSRSATM